MLEKHQKLSELLSRAHKLAVEIENDGGNTQSVIHHLRDAGGLVLGRIEAYKEQIALDKQAAAQPQAEAKATTKGGENTAAQSLGQLS